MKQCNLKQIIDKICSDYFKLRKCRDHRNCIIVVTHKTEEKKVYEIDSELELEEESEEELLDELIEE